MNDTQTGGWLVHPRLATFSAITRSKSARGGAAGLYKYARRAIYVQHIKGGLDPVQLCLYIMPDTGDRPELPYEGMRPDGYVRSSRPWDHSPDRAHQTQIQIMLPTWPEVFAGSDFRSERASYLSTWTRQHGTRPVCAGQAMILGTRYGAGVYGVQVRTSWILNGDSRTGEKGTSPSGIRYEILAPEMGEKSEAKSSLCLTFEVRGWGLYGAPPPALQDCTFHASEAHRLAFLAGENPPSPTSIDL